MLVLVVLVYVAVYIDPCGDALPAVEGRPRSSAHTRSDSLCKLGLLRVCYWILPIFNCFFLVCRGGVGEGTKYPKLVEKSSFS